MIININGDDRFYNDTRYKWTRKWYPRLRMWYCIFVVLCIIILYLYYKEIISNKTFIMYMPFVHWILTFLFISIPNLMYSKYDYDYIETYYPELSKKIWIYGRENGIMRKYSNAFFDYESGADIIIDDIMTKDQRKLPLLFAPFIIAIINTIIFEFIR